MRLLLPIALVLVGTPTLAQPAPAPRDPNLVERAQIAAAAYHIIKSDFAHAEGLPVGYDFEDRYRQTLAEALSAPDRQTFSEAMQRLFASLRNGHTSFYDQLLGKRAGRVPFRVGRIGDRWTVLTSRQLDLAPGDVIEAVDGRPVDDWLQPVRDLIGQSGATALDRASWTRADLLPNRFTLTLDTGRNVPVDLLAPIPSPPAEPSGTQVTTRPDGVIVIRIPGFDEPVFEADAVAAIRANAGARAILLDLRGNGGGSTPVDLLTAIMMRPYRGTLVVTPLSIAEEDARAAYLGTASVLPTRMERYGPNRTEPSAGAWTGRLGVLIDGGCGSACEDFVIRFKDGRRGLVMGETTYGSTGQPYFVSYPEFGMQFQVSTKREFMPDGSPFEGVGVTPDVTIPLTLTDLRAPADLQLERAADRLLMP